MGPRPPRTGEDFGDTDLQDTQKQEGPRKPFLQRVISVGGALEGLVMVATGISNRMFPRRIFTSREIQRFTVENDVIAELILVTKVCMLVHVMSVM